MGTAGTRHGVGENLFSTEFSETVYGNWTGVSYVGGWAGVRGRAVVRWEIEFPIVEVIL